MTHYDKLSLRYMFSIYNGLMPNNCIICGNWVAIGDPDYCTDCLTVANITIYTTDDSRFNN